MSLVALATAIWMAVDSSQLGYDKRDVRGLAAMGPAGWFICGLFLWIIAFPLYLVKRAELKDAGERRRAALAAGMPAYLPLPPPGQPMVFGPPPGYGAPGYGAPSYGPPPGYGAPGYGAPGYGPPPGHGYGAAPGYGPTPPGYGAAPGYGPSPGHGPAPGYPPAAQPGHGLGQPHGGSAEPLTAEQVGDRIHKLDELRIQGILTDAEFEQQKAQLLARM